MTPALGQTRRAAAAGNRRSAAASRPEPAVRRATRNASVRVQRRVSGPAAPARAPRPQRTVPALRPLPVLGTIGSHALRAGKSLHGSSLLDRLLRGRGWVAMLGVLLIGLVALNVSLLKLNAQAGRNAAAARELRIANTELGGKVTRLSSAERLQKSAAALGYVQASPGNIRYLKSHGASDGKQAARKLAQAPPPQPVAPAPVDVTTDPTTIDTGVATDPTAVAQPETTEPAPVEGPATTDGGTVPPVETEPDPGTG